MGDDLGEAWGADGLGSSGDEGTSAAAAVAPKAIKNKSKKKKSKKTAAGGSHDAGGGNAGAALAGRKRERAQLSAEGFDDDESDDGEGSASEEGGGGDGGEGEDDEESKLKAQAEEEAKLRRAEKKKQKVKALKAKLKEKKKQRSAEEKAGGGVADGKGVGRGAASAGAEAAELWEKFCKVRGDLVTPLERDGPWITAGSLARVDGFGAHTDMKLVGFIKASLPDWKKRIQNRNSNAPRGSPSVLIVCAGARRCVEVMKHLTAFRCQVVKLFAKHLKLEEQKVMLRKGCFPLAVGTPGRMQALAACGSLRLDSAALVILDMGKNVKGRDVLDMDGVSADTMAFLAGHARPHLASLSSRPSGKGGTGGGKGKGAAGQLKIALY